MVTKGSESISQKNASIHPPSPMKTPRLLLLAAAPILLSGEVFAASVVTADFTMWQEYSVGPNAQSGGTPGWLSYVQNMRDAVTPSGFASAGDPSTPGYYSTTNDLVPLSQMVSTGPGTSTATARRFNSWHGKANPGAVFGPAFANEYGNYLYTPLLIVTSGVPITISSIDRAVYSAALGAGSPWQTGTWTTFGNSRVGVTSFGLDGVLGGGDDVYVTNGNMVDTDIVAMFATGIGNAMQLTRQFDGTPWPVSIPDEDIYPTYFNQWGSFVLDYRVDYTVNYSKGGGPVVVEGLTGSDIEVVPEPSTIGLGALACLGFLARRRRPRQG